MLGIASQFSENLTNPCAVFLLLVNAADNKQRDPKMNCIKIDVDRYEYFTMVSAGSLGTLKLFHNY